MNNAFAKPLIETKRGPLCGDVVLTEAFVCFTVTGPSCTPATRGSDKNLLSEMVLSSSMRIVLSMGFTYMQALEACSIFGDDVDSMICYLVEMGGSSASPGGSNQHKGKAAE